MENILKQTKVIAKNNGSKIRGTLKSLQLQYEFN